MSEQTHPEHGTPEQGAASETTAANEHGFGIDEAIGGIMAQERYTQAQAFAILRGASQNRNLKLRDIAVRIVTSVSGRPPQLPSFDDSCGAFTCRVALDGWLGMTWQNRWRRGSGWRSVLGAR